MKVLLIALGIYSRTGGLEAYMRRVVRCLAQSNGEAPGENYVTCLWDEPPHAAGVPAGVGFFPGSSGKLRTAAHFLEKVRAMRPDVIIYDHVMLAPLAVLARTISPRSRQMLFVYGTEVWNDPCFRKVPLAEIIAVRRCIDLVVTISNYTGLKMAKAFGLPKTCFRLLPCAVDLDKTDWQSDARRTNRQRGTLLTVSRMGPKDRYKGIDKVILSLPQILSAVPQARYLVVGEGSLRAELMALAERTGVAGRIDFLGNIDDDRLAKVYESSDVFVMPSTGEGFGIVFLEAWKHRLPVICGTMDASTEVVTNGLNGLTVDPADCGQIEEAVIRLLSDENLSASLGEQGFRTLAEKYTHQGFFSRFEGILAEPSVRN